MKFWVLVLVIGVVLILGIGKLFSENRVFSIEIDSKNLNEKRKLWIYLPKNYTETTEKYPVLYMHDAQNLFASKLSFAGEWEVDETLDSLFAKVIVVGIEHGNQKRLEELTPYPHEKYGGGKADGYLKFVVEKVIPHINQNYRTKTDAANTWMTGSSLGGLVSFYAALQYPEIFGKVGVFSPSFWFSDQIYFLAEKQKNISNQFYFMCGDSESKDMVPDLERMTFLLKTKIS
jgi:alpha-glucosidase